MRLARLLFPYALTSALVVTAGEVELDGRTFRLPDGFTVERVAGPPLVERPITAAFDEQGRLYVADSSGSNDPVEAQLAERPHRIVRLEDTDGDGVFDRSVVFADRMMFPEGTLWHGGSLYVAAPPQILKLTDDDGDGVADRREVWHEGGTLTGCANDLHGPYFGPDGRIYWCKGAFAEQARAVPGRGEMSSRAAHILRRHPDRDEPAEVVMTGGMDNPVDVAFLPGGERVFTTTFLQHPAGGRRDGLIHAIYGGVWGKVHDVIEGHPRTAREMMPVLVHLGPAAPSGLARYESDAFGPGYRDNLFAAEFNMHKVSRHALTPDGSSYAAESSDMLATDDVDFHPTDVVPDADGSLLVLDTGGWYKLCCPTSQLHKPDVRGAIYRVRRIEAPSIKDPRGLALAWRDVDDPTLIGRLGDPRPAVRERAREALARPGELPAEDRLPLLKSFLSTSSDPVARENAVWVASRLDHRNASRVVAEAAQSDLDDDVRQAALNALSLARAEDALPTSLSILRGDRKSRRGEALPRYSSRNRRLAAETLGRLGPDAPLAVPFLLDAAADLTNDRGLEHAITFALIEIGRPEMIAAGLESDRPGVRRAALVVLDQLGSDLLRPGPVAALTASEDPGLREAASWVLERHPEWGEALADFLREQIARADLDETGRLDLEGLLARFAGSDAVANLLAEVVGDDEASEPCRGLALRAMTRADRKETPDAWTDALVVALEAGDPLREPALAAARALRPTGEPRADQLGERLLAIALDDRTPEAQRLDALAALPGGLVAVPPGAFELLRAMLDPARPVADRLKSADVLAGARLDRSQRLVLADAAAVAGPIELERLLGAFEAGGDDEVGLRLVAALARSTARSSLREEALRPRLDGYGPAVAEAAGRLYAELAAGRAGASARVDGLLGSLPEGDARRGQAVFNGAKAACASCHAIGYLGGTLGPDLTRIGAIREARDLLESIVEPSASFVRSYEPINVATADGRVVSGLLRRDDGGEVILATAADREVRIPRDQVEEIAPGTVSVMPAGLDAQLTPQELADLLAFLRACR